MQFLRDYDHRSISFHRLVYQLKNAVDKGGFEEGELLQGWRGVWTPLVEIVYQNPLMDVDPMVVQPRVENMRTYLMLKKNEMAQIKSLQQLPVF